ncbi:MAG: hypothetical protein OER77_03920 [Myxococcales bacterium]|nr:hypothetical protein [Myxococcales bacterium]
MPHGKILLVTADDGAPPFIGNLPVSVCTPDTCPRPFPENLPLLLVDARVGVEMCMHLSRRATLKTPNAIRILYDVANPRRTHE